MNTEELTKKILQMSLYCNAEGIASAMKIPVEVVLAVLAGKPLQMELRQEETQPIMVVKATTQVHKQKCIAILRSKGGVGSSSLAIHLASVFSERFRTLLMDCSPSGGDTKQYIQQNGGSSLTPSSTLHSVPLTDNFHICYPLFWKKKNIVDMQNAIELAKSNFDVILLDLPNVEQRELQEIVDNCSSVIILADSTLQNIEKLISWPYLNTLPEKYLVINNVWDVKINEKTFRSLAEHLAVKEGVYLPYETNLNYIFTNGSFASYKSAYQSGIFSLAEAIFPGFNMVKKEKSILGRLSDFIGGE